LGLCTYTEDEKVVLFGFRTGSKGKNINFYSSNIHNSYLIPVLTPKNTTFSNVILEIPKKSNTKFIKSNFWVFVPVQIAYFWASKNFEKVADSI
jgi:hypothetical protein